jgi:hypothetical protein
LVERQIGREVGEVVGVFVARAGEVFLEQGSGVLAGVAGAVNDAGGRQGQAEGADEKEVVGHGVEHALTRRQRFGHLPIAPPEFERC